MQWIAALPSLVQLFACSVLAWSTIAAPAPASAQPGVGQRAIITTSWVEEWDPRSQRWVKIGEVDGSAPERSSKDHRARWDARAQTVFRPKTRPSAFATGRPSFERPLAQYGPFLVMSEERAAIVGSTDAASPAQFDAMIEDFPSLETLDLIEAPGTSNDIANLAVGRRIRAHGLDTHVPSYGSVRSGAVELFLAGVEKSVDHGAWFAVHSWIDNYGREPDDFAPNDPANRLYLDYYEEMGMSGARAREFYAMTNSVPHHSAKWLRAEDMRPWISADRPSAQTPVSVASPLSLAGNWGNSYQRAQPWIGYLDVTKVAVVNLGSG